MLNSKDFDELITLLNHATAVMLLRISNIVQVGLFMTSPSFAPLFKTFHFEKKKNKLY